MPLPMPAHMPAHMPAPMSVRLAGLDRLRCVLTLLVIAHHAAITYGGSGGWFYREIDAPAAPSSLLLSLLCAVNQSFFMGLFFLLAGLFTPAALAHKGPRRFLLQRGLRLGLPLLVFGWLLGPLTVALAQHGLRPASAGVLALWLELLRQHRFVLGPLWFVWALLLLSLAYVAWDRWAPPPQPAVGTSRWPSPRRWRLAALAMGLGAFAVRLWVPVGREVLGIQLGHAVGYGFWFALGCALARRGWPLLPGADAAAAPAGDGQRWRLRWSLWAVPVLPLTAAALGALRGEAVPFAGGWHVAALVYALWEPWVAIGLITALLAWASHGPPPKRWQPALHGASYAAYVLHAPVLVAVAVALRSWPLPALPKFLLVTGLAAAASFALAVVLRRAAWARRLL